MTDIVSLIGDVEYAEADSGNSFIGNATTDVYGGDDSLMTGDITIEGDLGSTDFGIESRLIGDVEYGEAEAFGGGSSKASLNVYGGDDVLMSGNVTVLTIDNSKGEISSVLIGDVETAVVEGGNAKTTVFAGNDIITAGDFNLPAGSSIVTKSVLVGDVRYVIAENSSEENITIMGGNDILNGSNINDEIFGDVQEGDSGVIYGGNDTLNGNDGDDHLYGGGGNDTLSGGEGSDHFVWRDGDDEVRAELDTHGSGIATDTIIDFNQTEGDTIEIGDMLEGSFDSDDKLGALGYISFDVDGGTTTLSRVYSESITY